MSTLQSLTNVITSNLQVIEDSYTSNNLTVPTLDDLFLPTVLDTDPTLHEAKQLVVAAAAQLIATIRPPPETIALYGTGMYTSVTLGIVVEANIPDILMAHGVNGLHVNEISTQSGVDASWIARILRFLATRHVFKEVSPDVFTNNRLSSLLIKGKSLQDIASDPFGKFDNGPLAAVVSGEAEEVLKCTTFLSTFVLSQGDQKAPFNMAFNTEKKMWDWYHENGNEWRARRFGAAMKGGAEARFPPQIFTDALSDLTLKPNDVAVDVGGSAGSLVFLLKKAYPELSYVVQDLHQQIADAQIFWSDNDPEALTSGKVKLQVHDFFTLQPITGAAIYLLRLVIHDWPDSEAIKILSGLRTAAAESSKLIIFDN
ncbi:S-adenosyl-L-methionine-dependent methyltransferase, partial [Cyathus striatus]